MQIICPKRKEEMDTTLSNGLHSSSGNGAVAFALAIHLIELAKMN
jgi:hypothetical protein